MTALNLFQIRDYYKEQLQGVIPEVFFVLGGGIREITNSKGTVSYKTSSYKGLYFPEKIGGAKARPIATVELSKYYPDAKIVTMSHRPNYLSQFSELAIRFTNSPTFAHVLSDELQKAGVNENRIITKPESTSTLTEIMEVVKLSAQRDWQNVAIVTNEYFIERTQTILDLLKDGYKRTELGEQLQFLFDPGEETDAFKNNWEKLEQGLAKFQDRNVRAVFVSAENVLRKRSPHYETLISKLMKLDGYQNVLKQEKTGNDSIARGNHDFAQDSFKEYVLFPT